MTLKRLLELVDIAADLKIENILRYTEPYYSPYYSLMYLLAKEFVQTKLAFDMPPSTIAVELGVESGRGSFSLLQGGARVYGVDNNPDRAAVLSTFPMFKMHIGSSTPVPGHIVALGKCISILHIDTEHSYSQAFAEFHAYRPQLLDGAVVLFDDTNAMEGEVKRCLKSLPYEQFIDDRMHPSCGYGGLIYKE